MLAEININWVFYSNISDSLSVGISLSVILFNEIPNLMTNKIQITEDWDIETIRVSDEF